MRQKTLSEHLQICQQHLSDIKLGKRNMTPKNAIKAEEFTGICRCRWVWPGWECPHNQEPLADPWKELKSLPEPRE